VKGRAGLWLALAGVVIVTVLGATVATQPRASGSALSRAAHGWLATRRLLEARGVATELVDRPMERDTATSGLLVITFPWQRAPFPEVPLFDHYLRRGGSLLLAYSGEPGTRIESVFFRELGAELEPSRPDPPLDPWRWRAYAHEEWRLEPAPDLPGLRPARVFAAREVPRAPAEARVFHRNEAGLPMVFSFRRGQGQIIVLPSEMLANGRLAEPGNVDWLVTLAASIEGPWRFDEYHHGLVAPNAGPATGTVDTGRFMDLYLGQVLFLYLLCVFALARRFGPPWRDVPAIGGSVAGFLVGLGAVHVRSRHHQAAAEALLERVSRLDARAPASAPPRVDGPAAFLALAQAVGRSQRRTKG